ncbi:LA_2272 family surface repeat-containing protein [Pontibacter sp. 13R65]|uniref:LA_2272 family surface repeat-containing protein n=1 Tax=Pontibacter sp. 13R65 TaxID=3127458 RepID=UPI00301CC7EA
MKKLILGMLLTASALQVAFAQEQSVPELEYRPGQVSVVPGVGTNGAMGDRYYSAFSFNLLGGRNGGVSGFELGSLFNIDKSFMCGAQVAGITNLVGGPVKGLQLGGILNTAGESVTGAQIAGIVSATKGNARGLQLSGIASLARDGVDGVQTSGIVNLAGGKSKGLQLGTVNIAKNIQGLQVGVVNIADSVGGGTLGLINIVRKNGYYRGEVWAGETLYGNAAFKMGTRKLYTILALGWRPKEDDYYLAYGLGLGTILGNIAGADVNLDLLTYNIAKNQIWTDGSTNQMHQVRLVGARELGGRTAVLLGATFNVMHSNYPPTAEATGRGMDIAPWNLYNKVHRNTRVILWPGLNLGLRF